MKIRLALFVLLASLAIMPACHAQFGPTRTTIRDSVIAPSGRATNGTLTVTASNAFRTYDGWNVGKNTTRTKITNGVFQIALAPNLGGTPFGSYYTAQFNFNDGSYAREYWVVPSESTVIPRESVLAEFVDPTIMIATSQLQPPSPCTIGQALVWQGIATGWQCANAAGGGGTWGSITGTVTNQTDLINYLSFNYVPQTRTVNTHPLTGNITIAYSDLSGLPTLEYQTFQQAGVSLPQRTVVNMSGSGVTCSDVPGSTPPSTSCVFTVGSGTANPAAVNNVSFSATPAFTCASASAGTIETFVLGSMTANVTGPTLSGCTNGEILNFQLPQDATGGRSFTWPSQFTSNTCPVNTIASVTTYASYYLDSSGVPQLINCGSNETPSIQRDRKSVV